MTIDELRDELPLLAGFVKVVLLDRREARDRLGTWLEAAVATYGALRQLTRAEAYRDLAVLPHGPRDVSAPNDDPLDDPVVTQMSPRERAWRFLVGPAGFAAEDADAILGEPGQKDCGHGRSASLGYWPDARLLRRAS